MDMSENQLFEHSFVVSVDDKRLKIFNKRFSDAGLKIATHWNGAYLDKEVYSHLEKSRINEIRLTMQELCNGLSQYFIVVMARCMKWPFVTIFEDDAKPVENIHDELKFFLNDIPDNIDVLRLGWTSVRDYCPDNIRGIANEKIHQKDICGSHAYIVFQKYYEDFILTSRLNPRADFKRINPDKTHFIYSTKKQLFVQENDSELEVMHKYRNGIPQ